MIDLIKLDGYLISPVTSEQTQLPFDINTKKYLFDKIPNNDFAYIQISDKSGFEILRINKINNELGAVRGRVGTRRLSFYAGAIINSYMPPIDIQMAIEKEKTQKK